MMSSQLNPYEVLQLPEDATYEQIKERYRHLSKMVHPDKHPIENYQIAQARFKQIDQAYKSISSDLRRYIFKHYGSTGITIVENNPFHFQEFERGDLTDPLLINKLDQIMTYCLLEEHASNQIDKTTLRSRSLLIVYRPINDINQLPSMDRTQFSFETSLPDFLGMSHTASIAHESEGLNNQAKSSMVFGIGSSKRLTQNLMFTAQTQVSNDKVGIQAGFDRVINNNLVLHFIPVSFQNGNFGNPQVGADFHRDNYYISSITDFHDFTFQVGTSPMIKTYSKSIKVSFDGQKVMLSPTYEKEITNRLRLFVQMHLKGQNSEKGITYNAGFAYGYKLKIMDELKLQLISYISPSQSNFQISILTPKFKASIPIFSMSNMLTFEMYKLGAFIGIYLSFQLYNYYSKKTQRRRKKIQFDNYNRLSVQKIAVAKSNSDSSITAHQNKEAEVKFEGLVVLLAYLGSSNSLRKTKKTIKAAINIHKKDYKFQELLRLTEQLENSIKTNDDDFKNQLYDITQSVQAKVRGSQLFEFNIEELRVNPCIDQKQSYSSLILYYSRGSVNFLEQSSNRTLRIGNMKKRYEKPWFLSVLDFFRKKMIN